MSTPANDWLLANGHNSGGMCEKCWREAGSRYAMGHGPYDSKNDAYYEVMQEAQDEAARAAAPLLPAETPEHE